VSDEPKKSVSLNKGEDDDAASPSAAPPRTVMYAVAAMALSGVAALVAAFDVYLPSVRDWLRSARHKDICNTLHDTVKDAVCDPSTTKVTAPSGATGKSATDALKTANDDLQSLTHDVAATQKGVLITVIVALVALGFVAYSVYRGRYWARWGVLGLWFLASFTGTLIGIQSALSIGSDIPAAYKLPAFLSSISLIAAVVLTNLRPSVDYFAANRPVPPAGRARPERPRRGLFAPPPPRDTARPNASRDVTKKQPAATRPANDPDRAKSKQRANTAAVAKGADAARARAKAAAKSRRTES